MKAEAERTERGVPSTSTRTASLPTEGRIRGSLNLVPGTPVPARWELLIRPSRFYAKGDAEERRIEFTGDQLDFDVQDLGFGGYDLQPLADGMNSMALPLELSPSTAEIVVNLVLSPAGKLHGALEHEDGRPADGIFVQIERTKLQDFDADLLRDTTTGLDGSFIFESLPDGEYELRYGEAFNPLLKPEKLTFVAPAMYLPTRKLIGISEVTIEVFDFAGNPIPDVSITGAGSNGGTLDHFTDASGRCRLTGMPVGHYRLRTDHPGFSSQGKVFDIEPTQGSVLRITLTE